MCIDAGHVSENALFLKCYHFHIIFLYSVVTQRSSPLGTEESCVTTLKTVV